MVDEQYFEILLERFLSETISPEELQLLLKASKEQVHQQRLDEVFFEKLKTDAYRGVGGADDQEAMFRGVMEKAKQLELSMTSSQKQSFFDEIIEGIDDSVYDPPDLQDEAPLIEIEPINRRYGLKRWMIAASIIVLLGIGIYFIFFNDNDVTKQDSPIAKGTDVEAPKSSKAMITLASGKKIYLDSTTMGQIALQGNVKIIKLGNGQIAYESVDGQHITGLQYNTLYNPRGSQVIDMTLADGSRVWLNAGSSISYPVAFIGNERKVSITGEAYFEVAHNTAMPFKVSKGETEVTVLGTHFNMNAYEDEKDIKVTLLEGSVRCAIGNGRSAILKPGEQALINSSTLQLVGPDLEEVMAWKNGLFKMKSAGISTIMKQVARWYDIEVEYPDGIPAGTISGKVPRTLNLADVLKVYTISGVQFRIEGRKVVVLK